LKTAVQVRFAVLRALQELYTRLGEEFVVLLPETIPFLAELMEGKSKQEFVSILAARHSWHVPIAKWMVIDLPKLDES
jgi:hypothetical protein